MKYSDAEKELVRDYVENKCKAGADYAQSILEDDNLMEEFLGYAKSGKILSPCSVATIVIYKDW